MGELLVVLFLTGFNTILQPNVNIVAACTPSFPIPASATLVASRLPDMAEWGLSHKEIVNQGRLSCLYGWLAVSLFTDPLTLEAAVRMVAD